MHSIAIRPSQWLILPSILQQRVFLAPLLLLALSGVPYQALPWQGGTEPFNGNAGHAFDPPSFLCCSCVCTSHRVNRYVLGLDGPMGKPDTSANEALGDYKVGWWGSQHSAATNGGPDWINRPYKQTEKLQ